MFRKAGVDMEHQNMVKEMTLKEAKSYQESLKWKLNRVENFSVWTNNFYITTEEHLRKEYNPDAENEMIIVPKHDKMICEPMKVVEYMEDLVLELENLTDVMEKEMRKAEVEFEKTLFWSDEYSYKRVQSTLETLVNFNENILRKENGYDMRPPVMTPKMPVPLIPPRPSVPPVPEFLKKKNQFHAEDEMCTDYKLNAAGEQVSCETALYS